MAHPAVLVDGLHLVGQVRAVLHAGAVQAVVLLDIGAVAVFSTSAAAAGMPIGRPAAVVCQARQKLCAELLYRTRACVRLWRRRGESGRQRRV